MNLHDLERQLTAARVERERLHEGGDPVALERNRCVIRDLLRRFNEALLEQRGYGPVATGPVVI